MELLSKRKAEEKKEYEELKITLSGLGYFEDNMPLCEMREILIALQMSDTSSDTEKGLKAAEQENEQCFLQSENVFSSTMIAVSPKSNNISNSPPTTPEPHFEIITVQAIVHHSFDWSPTGGNHHLDDDRYEASTSIRKRNMETTNSMGSKRLRLNSIENAPDSGVNLTTTPDPESEQKSDATSSSTLLTAATHEWSENDSVNISDFLTAQLDVDSSHSLEQMPEFEINNREVPFNDESEFMEHLTINEY